MEIHIGLDLSFNSTGMTIYTSDTEKNIREIEFHRIVKSGSGKSDLQLININYHIVNVEFLSLELEMKHQTDMYVNGIDYSNEQIRITTEYFLIVTKIVNIIKKSIQTIIERYKIENNKIELYINMEGSLLSGYNYNSQIGLNMLQGYLRAELIKLQLKNKFFVFKQRIIPPKLLKSFFTGNGKSEKIDMIKSFINNYHGNVLIPQISLSNRMIDITNDIVDSFATIVFNVYDLKMKDKQLFNIKKPDNKKKIKRKRVSKKNVMDMSKFIPDNITTQINTNHNPNLDIL